MGMLHKVEDKFGRQSFYDELKGELYMHSADDLVMRLCDFDRYIGRHSWT